MKNNLDKFINTFTLKRQQIIFSDEIKIDESFRNKLNKNDYLLFTINNLGLKSINNGLFSFFNLSQSFYWTNIIENYFSEYSNKIICFGYDWMGRIFAMNIHNTLNYFFDPATMEVFELEIGISELLNEEFCKNKEELLVEETFILALKINSMNSLSYNHCFGFKKYLFLGGEDIVENMEIVDLKLYWELNYQIFKRING